MTEGYLAETMAEANAEIKEQEAEGDRVQKGTREFLYVSENEEEVGELSNVNAHARVRTTVQHSAILTPPSCQPRSGSKRRL